MTKLLPTLLKSVEHAGASERKELASKIPKNLYYELDGKQVSIRELIASDSTNSTSLIQTEVYNTIIEGAQPAIGMRNAVDIIQMGSEVIRVNKGTAGVYAPYVEEGSDIPVHNEGFTPVTITARKSAARPLITKELVADGLFDVVNDAIKYLGRSLENKLNYVALDTMLEGSGNEHDAAGSNLGIKAVAAGQIVQKLANWMPTDLIVSPGAEGTIMQDYLPTTANFQVGNATTTGQAGVPVLGMGMHTVGTTTSGTTYTWAYAADGNIGMLLHDRTRGAKIGMREDISIEQYDDPIKDLVGITGKIRFGCSVLNSTAITRVEY